MLRVPFEWGILLFRTATEADDNKGAPRNRMEVNEARSKAEMTANKCSDWAIAQFVCGERVRPGERATRSPGRIYYINLSAESQAFARPESAGC